MMKVNSNALEKLHPQLDYVYYGDCLEYMRRMPNSCVDLIITDPPFNIGKKYDSYKDNLRFEEYLNWCYQWLDEAVRILKPEGSLSQRKVFICRQGEPWLRVK
ncbi:MAG: hypothetical protein M1160_01675 [Candidatus Marsarchaeota archaeon]|jgi:DNA modification methylase|nr:hypothetical protein [Candidatus Marsarchaeota archaeon]MCL5111573.1 hypothetical protein [Candidatus Marsarchaeota archaeon]